YDIKVHSWTFLEAGEAKTTINSHYAQKLQGYQKTQAQWNIKLNNFSPAVINKSRDKIEQPNPNPDPTRLLISEIKKELDQRSLEYNTKENRRNLINLLKMNDTYELYIVVDNEALKKNQIYRKKEGGKCITETVKEILKSFFHANNKDK
ncbi:8231_t:CDS:2, partial [Scutellospora calospora]